MNDKDFSELCESGTIQEIQAELEKGSNANARNNYGRTALMCAAKHNKNPEVITTLINAGFDINARDEYGRTALMCAAVCNENPEVITALINAGTDVDARDKDRRCTSLMCAAQSTKRPPAESRWVSFATESRLYRLKPAKKSTG